MREESFAPQWLFWLGLLVLLAGFYFDYYNSTRGLAYGSFEKKKVAGFVTKDKYGYFSLKRWMIAHIIFTGILVLIFAFTGEGLVGMTGIVCGVITAVMAYGNYRKQNLKREEQIATLRTLSKVPNDDWETINNVLGARKGSVEGGRGRIYDFPWLYIDGLQNNDADVEKLRRKVGYYLAKYSKLPESQWFKDVKLTDVSTY